MTRTTLLLLSLILISAVNLTVSAQNTSEQQRTQAETAFEIGTPSSSRVTPSKH